MDAGHAGVLECRHFHARESLRLGDTVAAPELRTRGRRETVQQYPGRESNPHGSLRATAFKAADFASLSTRAGEVRWYPGLGFRAEALAPGPFPDHVHCDQE